MGNRPSFLAPYSVAVEPSKNPEKRTPVLRNATHPESLVGNWNVESEKCENCWDLFLRGKNIPGSSGCLGTRKRGPDGTLLSSYEWLSFHQVEYIALTVGSYLMEHAEELIPKGNFPDELILEARSPRLLGIFSKNTLQWFLTEFACNAYGVSIVPLYDTLGAPAIRFILSQTGMRTVAASAECLVSLLNVLEDKDGQQKETSSGETKVAAEASSSATPETTSPVAGSAEPIQLKNVICFDPPSAEILERAEKAGLKIIPWTELVAKAEKYSKMTDTGETILDDNVDRSHFFPRARLPASTISTICYTSGTTGNPRGAVLTHGNFVGNTSAVIRGPITYDQGLDFDQYGVHLSYLPLAHVFERAICSVALALGGRIGIYSGDTMKLLDDVKALKPTLFTSVPRLFNRINDKVFGGIKEKNAVTQFLFNSGVTTKMNNVRREGTVVHKVWDTLVFNKIKVLMGGKLECMISGGAPLEAVIQDRMKVLFCAYLIEGYGMTESLGTSFIQRPMDPLSGHIGGPLPSIEFCLESVPEMDYFVTDDPPRGALLIRGTSVSQGYFRNPEETKSAIDEEGWLRTGDVVVLLPNGGVKIIDRQKNLFKLAQGEYISPEKIENVYQQAPFISQLFAFGYSTKFNLVGIVVPDGEVAARWASRNNVRVDTLEEICENPEFKAAVMAEMNQVAADNSLKGFEKIKEIKLVAEAFSVENGLLTPTFKLKRHFARTRFMKDIDELYERLDQQAVKSSGTGEKSRRKAPK